MAAPVLARSNRDAIFSLLEEVSMTGAPTSSLSTNLQKLGAFAADSPILAFSSMLADALPKHWGGGGAVSEQLRSKQERHNGLLQALGQGGALTKVHPSTLRRLFDNGEKIAAVAAVFGAEDSMRAEHAEQELGWLQQVVNAAGLSVRSQAVVQNREDWELFYATPTQTAAAFFVALQQQCSSDSYHRIRTLASVAMDALAAASQQQAWHMQRFAANMEAANTTGVCHWTADSSLRGALLHVCRLLAGMLASLHSQDAGSEQEACFLLQQLTDLVLNAFASALTSLGQDPKLQAQYAAARQELLRVLLDHACSMHNEGSAAGEALLQRVQTTAEAHRGYEQLFGIAQYLGDPGRLFGWMESLGAENGVLPDSFAAHVFDRLRQEGRLGELLELPPNFDEPLATWIAAQGSDPQILQLRWLHEVRMRRTAAAAGTLAALVQAPPEQVSVEEARDLACLSKLAALAALPAGDPQLPAQAQASIQAANARLTQARVQSSLGLAKQPLQQPQTLLDAAVEGRGGAECAFDILASSSHEFRVQNRRAWEAALGKLVTEYEWEAVRRRMAALPEDEVRRLLGETPVAKVAMNCYAGIAAGLHSNQASFAQDCPKEEAAHILKHAARSNCPEAENAIALAFSLGCRAQYV